MISFLAFACCLSLTLDNVCLRLFEIGTENPNLLELTPSSEAWVLYFDYDNFVLNLVSNFIVDTNS